MESDKFDKEIITFLELGVFIELDQKNDLELILLKGHLYLETILEAVLRNNNYNNFETYSFYRKITILENIEIGENKKKEFIISSLKEINRLRNKIAHELKYKITDGELKKWATNILENLEGEKFTKYTYRTKIVHAYSTLSKNLLEL